MLRYASPNYDKAAFDPAAVKHWMPVDIYTGGAEHAVMHLFYTRFFIKAIRDMGLVDFGEPFKKLFNQGIIIADHQKMSKSKGNVVNPDAYVNDLGADTVRAYLMFVGPWEQGGEWDDSGISGFSRWLNRITNLALDEYRSTGSSGDEELIRITHQTIKKASEDIERMRFNTMVAALMELSNYLGKVKETGAASKAAWEESVRTLLLLLAPTAPHITEELWERIGGKYSIHNQPWPKWDESLIKTEEFTLVIQVNGKLRDRVTASCTISDDEAKELAQQQEKVRPFLEGKKIVNIIYVPGKLVNIVVR
jgi:leucyl-tRNA synthetase